MLVNAIHFSWIIRPHAAGHLSALGVKRFMSGDVGQQINNLSLVFGLMGLQR